MLHHHFRFLPFILIVFFSCKEKTSNIPEIDQKVFNAYWNQGKGEISSYALHQSRYGQQYEGSVSFVFEIEVISKSKQVKLDDAVRSSNDALRILRLNADKEFTTGVDKTSMMTSVFTPLDYDTYPHSIKLVASTQEWSGQTFTQLNWKENRYEVQQFSYIESEGDNTASLISTWLEDEIWTKIRVSPNRLPIGEVTMIPSAMYLRLSHQAFKTYDAVTALKTEGEEYTYVINYPELKRVIEMNFQKTFPYKIMGWKETYGNNEITTARITNTIMSDYRNHYNPEDEVLRDELQLK